MKKKTKWIIGGVAAVIVLGALFGGGNNNKPSSTTPAATETEKKEDNVLLTAKLKEADVMNGFGDTVIGKRAYIEIKKSELEAVSQEQFQEFVNTVVKDSDYNYVTIIAQDASKGIMFPGSMVEIAEYGIVDIDGTLKVVLGNIVLQEDGTYKYEKTE